MCVDQNNREVETRSWPRQPKSLKWCKTYQCWLTYNFNGLCLISSIKLHMIIKTSLLKSTRNTDTSNSILIMTLCLQIYICKLTALKYNIITVSDYPFLLFVFTFFILGYFLSVSAIREVWKLCFYTLQNTSSVIFAYFLVKII